MAESYSVYDTINTRIESGDLKGILTLEYITAFPTEDFLGKYVLDDIIPRIIQGYRIACDWETRGFSRPVAMRTITLARFQARYLAYQLQLPIFSIRYEGFCDSSYASKLKAVAKIFDAVNGLPCILYFEGIDRLSPGFKTWMEIAQFGSVLCQELDNLSAKVITVMSYYDLKIAQDIESMLLAMKITLLGMFSSSWARVLFMCSISCFGSPFAYSVQKVSMRSKQRTHGKSWTAWNTVEMAWHVAAAVSPTRPE